MKPTFPVAAMVWLATVPVVRAGEVTIAKWSVHDIVLTAAAGGGGPPADVTATFTGPAGVTKTVTGFWDGGTTVRIRFTPTAVGRWVYTTRSTDGGLNGKGGAVVCGPPGDGSHGFLRRDPAYPYHFLLDDGTRFYLCGQTYYRLLDAAVAGDGWKEAIDGTRKYGMNKVRFYAYKRGYGDPAVKPADVGKAVTDMDRWRKLDEVVRYLGERGMIADLILASKGYTFGTAAADRQYAQYIAARYAAFPNVAFCLSNEWNYTPKPREYWNTFGKQMYDADPWAVEGKAPRLLSVHQQTRWDFQFFGQPWVSHAIVQVGVRNGQAAKVDEFKEAEANKKSRIREGDLWGNRSILANWGHNLPVVNDEFGYIGEPEDKSEPARDGKPVPLTREKHRQILWGIAAAGGYGSAGDKTTYPEGKPYSTPSFWKDVPEYGDIKRMVDFFTTRGIEYWKAAGHNELAKAGQRVYVLAEPGRQYVVYAAVGGEVGVELAAGTYTAARYDPRTGNEVPLGTVVGGAVWKTALPAGEDWVVHLNREGR